MAGALAEEGMELKEITKRVSMIAKTMGEYLPRNGRIVADMGGTGSYQLHQEPFQVISWRLEEDPLERA